VTGGLRYQKTASSIEGKKVSPQRDASSSYIDRKKGEGAILNEKKYGKMGGTLCYSVLEGEEEHPSTGVGKSKVNE